MELKIISTLMMEAETVSETLHSNSILTWPIAGEDDFIALFFTTSKHRFCLDRIVFALHILLILTLKLAPK
jgi:hypothetical protein